MAARCVTFLAAVILLVFGGSACSPDSSPEVPVGPGGPADAVLIRGREVYEDQCARCHGAAGGGDVGPRLGEGRSEERYPDVANQIEVVSNGKGSQMPAFADRLTPTEIEGVVRYTREVL